MARGPVVELGQDPRPEVVGFAALVDDELELALLEEGSHPRDVAAVGERDHELTDRRPLGLPCNQKHPSERLPVTGLHLPAVELVLGLLQLNGLGQDVVPDDLEHDRLLRADLDAILRRPTLVVA